METKLSKPSVKTWARHAGLSGELCTEFSKYLELYGLDKKKPFVYERPSTRFIELVHAEGHERKVFYGLGRSLMEELVRNQDWEGVKIAQDMGLNINALTSIGTGVLTEALKIQSKPIGQTCLRTHIAQCVKNLMDMGAMLDAREEPYNKGILIGGAGGSITPLHWALYEGNPDRTILEVLLSGVVNKDQVNKDSMFGRPLEVLLADKLKVSGNDFTIGIMLIEKGASFDYPVGETYADPSTPMSLREKVERKNKGWYVLVEAEDALVQQKELAGSIVKGGEISDPMQAMDLQTKLRV